LRVFGVNAAAAEELDNGLAWYAELLGQVRDREVLSARLTELIAELPTEYVRGPVEAEITKILAKERDDRIQRLNAAMRTRALHAPRAAAARMEDRTAVH
jgi:CHAD domain-containing protein